MAPLRSYLLMLAAWALTGCDFFAVAGGGVRTTNGEEELAGGGIRTTNGEVAGRIKSADASPAEGVQVRLYKVFLGSSGSAAMAEWAGISDSDGIFRFQNVPGGTFAMSVTDPVAGTRAIMPRLNKSLEGFEILDAVLSPWITLVGRAFPSDGGAPDQMRVCIPGLPDCVTPGHDSVYAFPRAPQGDYDLVFLYKSTANYLPIRATRKDADTLYVKDIRIDSGAVPSLKKFSFYETDLAKSLYVLPKAYPLISQPPWYSGKSFDKIHYFEATNDNQFAQWDYEDYLEWAHRKLIPLRAFAPADTTRVLRDFPYFLRLTKADIDFSQVNPDGSDIRISRNNFTKHVPYSMEKWDPNAGVAELWVSLDNLSRGNADQALTVYWGNADAEDRSDHTAILGSAAEARQVWPFDDNANSSLVSDKRGTHPGFLTHRGAPVEATARHADAGILGTSLRLDGSADLITVDPHPVLDYQDLTISLWARHSLPTLSAQEYLVLKGDDGHKQWHLALDSTKRLRFGFGKDAGAWSGAWVSRDPVPAIDSWHFYAATFKAGVVHVYLDGRELAAATPYGVIPKAIPAINSPIYLGKGVLQTEPFWAGWVDNLSLENQAQTADWIAYLFATQNPTQKP